MTLFALAGLLLGCNGSQPETPEPAPVEKAEPAADVKAEPTPAPKAEPEGEGVLFDPSLAAETAPDTFKAKFETTKGDFVVEVHRDWAPVGADRFYNLVKAGYYSDVAFFRTVANFMAQFGIHGDPKVNRAWREARIADESQVVETNSRGRITFAKTNLPNSRTTQLFINFRNNGRLDKMGFAPFGEVVEGMDIIDSLHMTGEGFPSGSGPNQAQIQAQGNEYLRDKYPDIDYIKSVTVIE
ncbi:MAG: peptidylprolyl isomerase [Myxococcota bacterium]